MNKSSPGVGFHWNTINSIQDYPFTSVTNSQVKPICVLRQWLQVKEHLLRKTVFFRALPKLPLPLPPIRATCTIFFGRQKQCLARITEPSNDDYVNDVSDNFDHNFGTFDDFGVKNDQKVSHNMILMSKYKG